MAPKAFSVNQVRARLLASLKMLKKIDAAAQKGDGRGFAAIVQSLGRPVAGSRVDEGWERGARGWEAAGLRAVLLRGVVSRLGPSRGY